MPIYDFECAACGKRFDELVRRVDDLVDVRCPECGASEVRREVSAPSIGSGASGAGSDYTPPRRATCSPFS